MILYCDSTDFRSFPATLQEEEILGKCLPDLTIRGKYVIQLLFNSSSFKQMHPDIISLITMTSSTSSANRIQTPSQAWKSCIACQASSHFKSPGDFTQHLRDFHCSKEGGSYVCRYGSNGVCPSLPLEGVSDRDYEDHVSRDHVYCNFGKPLLI